MEKKIDIYKHQKKKLKIENPKKVSVIIPNYNYEKYSSFLFLVLVPYFLYFDLLILVL